MEEAQRGGGGSEVHQESEGGSGWTREEPVCPSVGEGAQEAGGSVPTVGHQ